MKLQAALISLSLFACFPACTKESGAAPTDVPKPAVAEKPKDDCANCVDAVQVSATPAAKAEGLQKGITLTEFTPISKIVAAFPEFEGKRVLVKGEAVSVCATRGCFVTLKSDDSNQKALRVKVEDGEIVFPMSVKGQVVEAEGIIEKTVIKEEDYRKILQDRATKDGKEFDPASVKGDYISWQLRGLGAKFPKT